MASKLEHFLACLPSSAPVVARFDAVQQQAFAKITKQLLIALDSPYLVMTASRIAQYSLGANLFIEADLSALLGGKYDLSFHLDAQIQKHLTACSTGNQTVYLDTGDRYQVTNGHLWMEVEKVSRFPGSIPVPVSSADHQGAEIVDIRHPDIKTYIGKSKTVLLVEYDGQLEQVAVPGKAPYSFNPASGILLMGKTPSQELPSSYLLAGMSRNDFKIRMARNSYGCWLVSSSKLNHLVTLKTYELLTE